MAKRVLVTGGAGFISSHVSEYFLGWQPSTPLDAGLAESFKWFEARHRATAGRA